VTNGWKYEAGGQVINDHRFAYFFDDIGNRTRTVTNGTAVNYAANLLNQYTNVGGRTLTNDPDGNLPTDSGWTNTWDAENRLLTMTTNGQMLAFAYDCQGRRIQKQVWKNTAGTGSPVRGQRFVYDGWNLVGILNCRGRGAGQPASLPRQ
jgi:YD repeat-containing protein